MSTAKRQKYILELRMVEAETRNPVGAIELMGIVSTPALAKRVFKLQRGRVEEALDQLEPLKGSV
jgi:hypothetical protein